MELESESESDTMADTDTTADTDTVVMAIMVDSIEATVTTVHITAVINTEVITNRIKYTPIIGIISTDYNANHVLHFLSKSTI